MVIKPKVRNNIFMNAHPVGCAREVQRQIDYVKAGGEIPGGKRALIIGCSSGFGLASRISSAFACKADTVGVMFEREGTEKRTGTPGWYNTRTFEAKARAEGRIAETINGDAFSIELNDTVPLRVLHVIRKYRRPILPLGNTLEPPAQALPEEVHAKLRAFLPGA